LGSKEAGKPFFENEKKAKGLALLQTLYTY